MPIHVATRAALFFLVLRGAAACSEDTAGDPSTDDTTPPETLISGGPSGLLTVDTASIVFNGTDDVELAGFECWRDGDAFATCTSPVNLTALAEGAHTFAVQAVDAAGNADASPAINTWTVDTVAPTTTFGTGPEDRSNSVIASFTFSSPHTDIDHFECDVDGTGFAECTSPLEAIALLDGEHTLDVRAVDLAGWVEQDPPRWRWTLDTRHAPTRIASGPDDVTLLEAAVFTFESPAADVERYECSLNQAAYATCPASGTFPAIPLGDNTLDVRTVDLAGNVDPTVERWRWNRSIGAWAEVSDATAHTCAITVTGTLWCWGFNAWGQLGLGGTRDDETMPRQEVSLGTWTHVSTGDMHTCAINGARALHCWGENSFGQLGTEAVTPVGHDVPTQVGGDLDWIEVAAGSTYTCGIRDEAGAHRLYCWGGAPAYAAYGQLGLGTSNAQRNVPALVGSDTDWASLDTGYEGTCGLKTTGALSCWGYNGGGQMGCGASPTTSPFNVLPEAGHTWVGVSAGNQSTCGLQRETSTDDVTLWCFGWEFQGSHGLGSSLTAQLPGCGREQEIGGYTDWVEVSHESSSTCGIREDAAGVRSLWCWGYGYNGRLGHGTDTSLNIATRVGTSAEWQTVHVGRNDVTSALGADNTLWTWGRNNRGGLGIGAPTELKEPMRERLGYTDWVEVIAGGYHTCGVRQEATGERSLWCWGGNWAGQLAQSVSNLNTNEPRRVDTDLDWDIGAAGEGHHCMITTGGTMYCWGANDGGAAGVGSLADAITTPEQESTDSADWLVVGAGFYHTLAVHDDGTERTLWAWGSHTDGQLGLGDPAVVGNTFRDPTKVGSATDWLDVTGGAAFSCGLRSGSPAQAYCWGANGSGQLGTGDFDDLVAPGPGVLGGHDWRDIVAGEDFACGLDAAGAVYCFGDNSHLQIAATGSAFETPQQKGAASGWRELSVGGFHACALNAANETHCWGGNDSGQLGDGSSFDRATPEPVPFADWVALSSGNEHTCGIRQDRGESSLWCWGAASDGQLGSVRTGRAVPGLVADPIDL
jgi:alpha-tubulin suppressor-like RCC1 family protein